METMTITTWSELSSAFVRALEMSDPTTAQPIGSAKFETVEGIVKMTVEVDMVPIPRAEDMPF